MKKLALRAATRLMHPLFADLFGLDDSVGLRPEQARKVASDLKGRGLRADVNRLDFSVIVISDIATVARALQGLGYKGDASVTNYGRPIHLYGNGLRLEIRKPKFGQKIIIMVSN